MKARQLVDSSGPGTGVESAGEGIRMGAFSGATHVSFNQSGVLETENDAQSSGDLFDALSVQLPALDGTAGTLSVPIHVIGGFSGTTYNIPTAAPAPPPTINGSFVFQCSGMTFAGGCGNDTVTVTEEDGDASSPFDRALVMTEVRWSPRSV